MNVVVPLKKEELADAGIIQALEDLLALAKEGELVAFCGVSELKDSRKYQYTRLNCTYEEAIGLHTRAVYVLNKDWDGR